MTGPTGRRGAGGEPGEGRRGPDGGGRQQREGDQNGAPHRGPGLGDTIRARLTEAGLEDWEDGEATARPGATSTVAPAAPAPAAGLMRRRLPAAYPHTPAQYVVTGILLVAIALGIGGALYARSKVPYSASCLFRVALPLTQQTGSDYFAASQYLSQTEVGLAIQNGGLLAAYAAPGVDPAIVARAKVAIPTGFLDYTSVTARSDNPSRLAASTNAVCNALVSAIKSARSEMRTREAADLTSKISTFAAQADAVHATGIVEPSARATYEGLESAITSANRLLSELDGTPPDVVTVTASARTGFRVDRRNLAADLFVAGAIGLVITFLVVLVAEAVLKPYLWRAEDNEP